MKTCSKCGSKKTIGFCEGCGEYASQCTCEPTKREFRKPTPEDIARAKENYRLSIITKGQKA